MPNASRHPHEISWIELDDKLAGNRPAITPREVSFPAPFTGEE